MIRIECGPPGQVRVIGSLEAQMLKLLEEAISRGAIALDLSEVDVADERSVRFLAELPPERCALVSCPRWLALWVERMRQGAAGRP